MRQRCEHALSTPREGSIYLAGEPYTPRSARSRNITSKNIETLLGEPSVRPSSRDSQRVALFSAHSLMQDVNNASAL